MYFPFLETKRTAPNERTIAIFAQSIRLVCRFEANRQFLIYDDCPLFLGGNWEEMGFLLDAVITTKLSLYCYRARNKQALSSHPKHFKSLQLEQVSHRNGRIYDTQQCSDGYPSFHRNLATTGNLSKYLPTKKE
jgi:hypothetical protein